VNNSKGSSNGRCYIRSVTSKAKTALLLGSSGSLGSAIASQLQQNHDCLVIGADVRSPSDSTLDAFLPLSPTSTLQSGLRTLEVETLDAIICANGAFALDDDNEDDASVHENMMQKNYYPVVAAASLLPQYMTSEGLFLAFGATAALVPAAPNLTAYVTSKAAVHHYLQSLGATTNLSLGKKKKVYPLPDRYLDRLTVLGVLLKTLDTEANHASMPDQDCRLWTKPDDVANEIGTWLTQPQLRPHSGSLVKVLTKKVREETGVTVQTEFHLAR